MTTHPVFVFGSNLAGLQGAGAALFTKRERGAVYGRGIGPQCNSCATPTKDEFKPILDKLDSSRARG